MTSTNQPADARSAAPEAAAIERSVAAAFDAAAVGMALTDLDGRFLRVNDGFCELLGYDRERLLDGMALADVTPPGRRVARPAPTAAPRSRTAATTTASRSATSAPTARSSGPSRRSRSSATSDGEPMHLLGLVQEITESKRRQADLARLALQDPLTGLANRVLMDDRLRTALARADRHGALTGVLFLDLDGFKAVNDRHGHHVGDEVLKAVARRLRAVLRPADVVARIGGDEFVAICEELHGVEEAHAIASRVEVAIAAPIATDAGPLTVHASVGLALAEAAEGADPDDLVRRADEAMYRAKQAGARSV